MASMVNCNSVTTLTLGLASRTTDTNVIMLPKNIAFTPAILSVAGKIHPEFLRLIWVLADMQTVKYFNLVGDTKRTSGMSVSSGVGLAHSAKIGMRLALPLHTLQPYALICQYMAPLTL